MTLWRQQDIILYSCHILYIVQSKFNMTWSIIMIGVNLGDIINKYFIHKPSLGQKFNKTAVLQYCHALYFTRHV